MLTKWSNGPLWIEVINLKFGFNALQRNNYNDLYGTDFAWGGSTSFSDFAYLVLPNLQTQIGYYTALLTTQYARMPNGTIAPGVDQYLFWDGTHPTRTVHALLGDKAYKLIVSTLNLPSAQPKP